jgi:DNA invertase Pin-like site-specific DNA recombinase
MRNSSGFVKRVGLAQQIMRRPKGQFPFAGEIVTLYKGGNSTREVANRLGVSKSHVLRLLKKAGIVRSQGVAQHLAAKKKRALAQYSTARNTRSV